MTTTVPSAGLNFTAVDFETANRSRASVCAVGAVRVRDGSIVDEFHTLVRPPAGFDEFEAGNIRVHGITEADVVDAPTWEQVYPTLMTFVGRDILVGHNAGFDVSVLLNATSACDLPWPEIETVCTLQLAQATLQIPSYSLPWVAEHLGLDAFDHHNPLADARTSALVLVSLALSANTTTVDGLTTALNVPVVPTFLDDAPSELDAGLAATGFTGQVVCFTGALRLTVRDDARRLVEEHGGCTQPGVNKKTTILVTGDFDTTTFRPGAVFSNKLQKAFDLVDAGQALEIITEDDFVARLSLSEEALRTRVAGASRRKLPEWVVTQAGTGPDGDYWAWLRIALAHPSGRADNGEICIWCERSVPAGAHWIHRDRHVCGIHCNERLKRSAARAWDRAGIRRPVVVAPWEQ